MTELLIFALSRGGGRGQKMLGVVKWEELRLFPCVSQIESDGTKGRGMNARWHGQVPREVL